MTPLLALLLACGDGGKEDSGPTTPAPGASTGTPTGTPATGTPSTGTPTGSTTSGWAPTRYRVAYGWFGVQANQATATGDVDLFGTPVTWPLQLAIRLADETIDTGLTPTNHCDVVLTTTTSQPPADWTADAGWFAVEFPADAAVSATNCDFDLAADWADPGGRVAQHHWGLALRAVEQTDVDANGGYGPTDPLAGKLLGASWWTDAAGGTASGGTPMTPGVAVAYAIDAQGELLRDANHDRTALDAATVPSPGGVSDGFYELTGLSDWRDAGEL